MNQHGQKAVQASLRGKIWIIFWFQNEQTLRWEHMQVRRVDGWKQFGSSNFEVVEDVKRRLGGSVSVRWRCPFSTDPRTSDVLQIMIVFFCRNHRWDRKDFSPLWSSKTWMKLQVAWEQEAVEGAICEWETLWDTVLLWCWTRIFFWTTLVVMIL